MILHAVLSVIGLGLAFLGGCLFAERLLTRRLLRELTGTLERPDEEVDP